MKKTILSIFLAVTVFSGVSAQEGPRIHENFDFDWKFHLGDVPAASAAAFDDNGWRTLHLPHDFSIEQDFDRRSGGSMGFLPGGIGWYRKTFDVPVEYKGKKVSILFDGVYHRSDVYINGKHLGFYPYGFIGFEYDLTPHLKYGGQNTIAVRVDHSNAPSARWYSGSGIYRDVWLTVTDPVRVETWGTYITTPSVVTELATVQIVTTLENNSSGRKNVALENTIYNAQGERINSNTASAALPRGQKTDVTQNMAIPEPLLWSPETPYLYTMQTLVKIDGQVVDHYETRFGVRFFSYDPDTGFSLNGKPYKMKGMNLHEDAGALGVAVPHRSNERKLQILKEFGCNALRLSHNPFAPSMLALCDELGFLVIGESFDKWKSGYYAEYFDRWWQTDLGSMIRRDRNHPSIVLWSIGNETTEQNDMSGEGTARAEMLRDYVHRVEPTRPVMAAIASGHLGERPYTKNGFIESLDVVGYNYMEPHFADDHQKHPEWIIFGSEVMPFYRGRFGYVRDYYPQNPWYDTANNDFIFGYFIWAGVDYVGESSGWPSKGWPTCPFATTMREKPRAGFLRSMWSGRPVVRIAVADQSLDIDPGKDHWSWPHLIDHWTFPQYKGHIIQVQTMTNCDEVELFVNERWMGKRKTADYTNHTIVWYVPYFEGKIYAKGYNNGQETAYYELNTAGEASRIVLTADRNAIRADGSDLSHIGVKIVDDKGVTVPNDDRMIHYEVMGAGALVGLDSGDLRSNESYKGTSHSTYFGEALAIVQSTRESGQITVRATAEGLPDAILTLQTR